MPTESISDLVLDVVLAILGIIASLYMRDRKRRERIESVLIRVHDAVASTVRAYEQSVVPQVKRDYDSAVKLSPEQGASIHARAVDDVIRMVSSDGTGRTLAATIGTAPNQLRVTLGNMVEAELFELKRQGAG